MKDEKMNEQKILERAKLEADKWLSAFHPSGPRDKSVALRELSKLEFDGSRVTVIVVDSPDDVSDAIITGAAHLLSGTNVPKTPMTSDQLKTEFGADFMRDVTKTVHDAKPNQCIWDYYLMAFYHSAFTAAGLEHPHDKADILAAFAAGLGFIVNLGGLIVGVMLPERAERDENLRIHCETGPAIVWGKDKQYWWRGVRVEEDWIMRPESVDPALALTEPNVERRRSLCEILTWEKVLKQLDPKVIDSDPDPQIGDLLSVDLPDQPAAKFLRVLCGTGRYFCLPVPENIATAIAAQAWMWQIEESEYRQLEART